MLSTILCFTEFSLLIVLVILLMRAIMTTQSYLHTNNNNNVQQSRIFYCCLNIQLAIPRAYHLIFLILFFFVFDANGRIAVNLT